MERELQRARSATRRGNVRTSLRPAGKGLLTVRIANGAGDHAGSGTAMATVASSPPSPDFIDTAPARAQHVVLDRDASTEDAFRAIASSCIAQVRANAPGVASLDGEGIHQMRVGLRRLRSALAVFAPAVACPDLLAQDLKWLADVLGTARDWDVLASHTLPAVIALLGETGQAKRSVALMNAAYLVAHRCKQEAADAVATPRYAALLDALQHWVRVSGWQRIGDAAQSDTLAAPARAFACHALRRRHRKLMRCGHKLVRSNAQQRHLVRIAAKKLRYTAEFFASLFPGKRARRHKAMLSALLDELGRRNDLVVGRSLLPSIATDTQTAISSAFLRGYLATLDSAEPDDLRHAWKQLRRTPRAW